MNFDFFYKNLGIHIVLILIFILLIILSGFFSSTEAAFSSSNPLRLKVFLEEKKKGAKKAVNIANKLDQVLVTLWICTTLVNVIATIIVGYFLYNIIQKIFLASLFTVLITSIIIIVFGKFIPKQNAIASPERIALRNSPIMDLFFKIFYPLSFLLLKLKKTVLNKSDKEFVPKVTEEELESIIDTMENEGVFDEEDAELIQSAIGLNDRTVYDIMTPRVDIVAIEEKMTIEEMKEIFFVNHFSRVPVYREDKDNIIGILREKDFFTVLLKNQDMILEDILSKPFFVSESTKVSDIIKEFQKQKKHFAVVVDEYGGTSGIVTMEDALEELVGEIYDEYDEEELENIVEMGDGFYKVSPEMEIEDLFDFLDIEDIPDSQYNTVGGFVYSLIGGIPSEGMVVSYQSMVLTKKYNLVFTLKTVENKRIRLLELNLKEINKEENSDLVEAND